MKIRFSIIVPVYNVAPYLRECLDSVLAQTHGDWECICVDDGSTDGSDVILDAYAKRDVRFKVVHKKNEGVSVARNVGLELANGDYFQFVDADDVIAPDALCEFARILQGRKVDGLLVNPFIWDGAVSSPARVKGESDVAIDLLIGKNHVRAWTVCRVYSRKNFGALRFVPGMRVREDLCFWIDALCIPAKWCFVEKAFYNYRQRNDSASHKMSIEAQLDLLRFPVYCLRRLRHDLAADEDVVVKFWIQEVRQLAVAQSLSNWRAMTVTQRQEALSIVDESLQLLGSNPLDGWSRIAMCFAKNRALNAMLPIPLFGRRAWNKVLTMLKTMRSV